MNRRVPHSHVVVVFCLLGVIGYAACSWWAIAISTDAAIRGDVMGTWKSFATLAFGFWIGSSSGGKARDVQEAAQVAPTPDPQPKADDGVLLLDTPAPDQNEKG